MLTIPFQNNDADILESSVDESRTETEQPQPPKRTIHEVESSKPQTQPAPRQKKLLGPASKRAKMVTSSTVDSKSIMKAESTSNTSTTSELIQFKMEPYESGDHSNVLQDSSHDKTYFDDTMGESHTEETEDYSLVEGTDDEPQASTSGDGEGQGTWNFIIEVLCAICVT